MLQTTGFAVRGVVGVGVGVVVVGVGVVVVVVVGEGVQLGMLLHVLDIPTFVHTEQIDDCVVVMDWIGLTVDEGSAVYAQLFTGETAVFVVWANVEPEHTQYACVIPSPGS